MIGMMQQGRYRVAGNAPPLPTSDEVMFPGQTIAGIEHITLQCWRLAAHISRSFKAANVRSMPVATEMDGA
jgi:hypothetical protein